MTTLFCIAGLGLLVALSAITVRRMIAGGVMDVPVARSSHERPTPKGGGWGVLAALLAGIAGAAATGLGGAGTAPAGWLALACLILGAVSWADDVASLSYAVKLAAQLMAAGLAILGGFTIERIGPLPLGAWGVPLTLAWLLFAINAINFIDGLNGLASGAMLVAALALAAVSAVGHGPAVIALVTLPLAAGLLGFLPFNFPRARIFMGDVGSQSAALALAAMAAPAGRIGANGWAVLLMPMALGPILADVGVTLLRRLIAGERVVAAHRGHLYQLAHRSGVGAARVTLIYVALTALGSLAGAVAALGPAEMIAPALAAELAAVAAWFGWVLVRLRRTDIGAW